MTPNKISTIWPIEPHTKAKHQILEEYLKAWFPIIGRWKGRIVYLDGFAGPGKYKGGEDGSPIIAMRTAVNHKRIQPTTEIVFCFIEKNKERSNVLKQTLEEFGELPQNMKCRVIDSDFEKSVQSILDSLEESGETLAPTFAFIDPFGYSDFSMNLVKRLLSYDKSEVLVTFMSSYLNRFLDSSHEDAFTKLYGSRDFLKARDIANTEERIDFLLELYEKKLKENNGVKYTRSFVMIGKGNKIIYHLIFGTKHWKGLEVIKNSMLKVDIRGVYSFSDRLGANQTFFATMKSDNDWMPKAAELIFTHFRGQSVEINKIHEFTITNTPYLFKKKILTFLEKKEPSQICHVNNRERRLAYPNGCVVTFSK